MMNMRLNKYHSVAAILILFCFLAYGKSAKQEGQTSETSKALKQNSPLDEQKKLKSKQMMLEIWKQLNFIPDMDYFLNIVNHCKDNHLFVNAEDQGYIIVAVS